MTSSTGLIAARTHPVYKAKPKKIELSGTSVPAPFILRPFAGLFNPFPYGCSVLCNHPADCEAKDFVRRAKESWATEGKAILLPAELDMIRATLLAGGVEPGDGFVDTGPNVPEELFRKYTETDSRPLTPTPTLASGPPVILRAEQDACAGACNPRERTTLVLDLRTASQEHQEVETLSWHAVTLEPLPSLARKYPEFRPAQQQNLPKPAPTAVLVSDESVSRHEDVDENSESIAGLPLKRRGKRLKKRKCRRGSGYGQPEVRDPLEPPETQISQVRDGSRRSSTQVAISQVEVIKDPSEKPVTPVPEPVRISSFLSPEILRHLGRELDRDIVEEEFNLKRKIALKEALRIKEETQPPSKSQSRTSCVQTLSSSTPRIFSRQSARFELLGSTSLVGLKPLDYLGRHVFLSTGRKLMFARTFNSFYKENLNSQRLIAPSDMPEALREVMGKPLTSEQLQEFTSLIGEIREPLDFRTFCGVCAACERLLTPLAPRDLDPPSWIEKADFEALERRLKSCDIDEKLGILLRKIQER